MTDNLSIENKLKEYFAKQYQITDSEDENPFYINRPEELNGGNNIEGIVENIMTGGRAGEKSLKMTKRKIKGLTGGKIRKDSSDASTKDSSDDSSDDSTKDSTDNSTKDSTKDSSDNSTDDSSDNSTKDSSDDSTKDSSDASTKKATKKASKKATKKMADKDDDDFDFQIFDSSGNEILDRNDSDTSSDSDDDRFKNKSSSSSSSSSDYVSDDDSLDDDALDDDEDIKNYIKKIMTGGKVETVKIIQKFPYVIEKEWRCVKIWLWKKCSSDLRKHGCERNVRQTYVHRERSVSKYLR